MDGHQTPLPAAKAAPVANEPRVPVLRRKWLRKNTDFIVIVGAVGATLGAPALAAVLDARGGMLSLLALLYWQGYLLLLVHLYRRQQHRLRQEIAADVRASHDIGVQGRPFVTLYAYSNGRQSDQDLGFVIGDDENLRFFGDRLAFTLSKSRIENVHRLATPLVGQSGIRIEWSEDGQRRALELRPKGFLSFSRKNSAAQSLATTIRCRPPRSP